MSAEEYTNKRFGLANGSRSKGRLLVIKPDGTSKACLAAVAALAPCASCATTAVERLRAVRFVKGSKHATLPLSVCAECLKLVKFCYREKPTATTR